MLERTDEYAQPVVITKTDRLEAFRKKSARLTPRCLGAFDPDDEICTKYCACGRFDFDSHDSESREVLNEPSGHANDSFFYNRVATPSCRQERSRLSKAIEDAERQMGVAVRERMSREHYVETMGRVPVGPVRYGKLVKNFVSMDPLYVDLSRNRPQLYVKEKNFTRMPPETVTRTLAKIKEIRGRRKPTSNCIKVLSQEVRGDTLVLTVKAVNETTRQPFGHRFRIYLDLSDALDSLVRMDDIGALD